MDPAADAAPPHFAVAGGALGTLSPGSFSGSLEAMVHWQSDFLLDKSESGKGRTLKVHREKLVMEFYYFLIYF